MCYILCRYINISVSRRRGERYLACCSLSAASALFSAASADMTTARRYESRVEGRGLRRGRSFRTSETRGPPLAHHCAPCIREREPISYRRRRTLAEKRTPRRASPVTQWRERRDFSRVRSSASIRWLPVAYASRWNMGRRQVREGSEWGLKEN